MDMNRVPYHQFAGRNGILTCQVTGTQQYSVDLPQGGLEIPIFSGEARLIAKVQKLLQEALTSGLLTPCNMDSEPQQKSPLKHPKKKQRIERGDSEQLDGIALSQLDKDQLRDGRWLSDKHINYAQSLLKTQFEYTHMSQGTVSVIIIIFIKHQIIYILNIMTNLHVLLMIYACMSKSILDNICL